MTTCMVVQPSATRKVLWFPRATLCPQKSPTFFQAQGKQGAVYAIPFWMLVTNVILKAPWYFSSLTKLANLTVVHSLFSI